MLAILNTAQIHTCTGLQDYFLGQNLNWITLLWLVCRAAAITILPYNMVMVTCRILLGCGKTHTSYNSYATSGNDLNTGWVEFAGSCILTDAWFIYST